MTEPLLTVRDLSIELAGTGGKELLRNYEFNISQGTMQRVSRCFDALALMGGKVEAPLVGANPGGIVGFGRKRNVCNREKSVHTVVLEQDAKVAALKAQILKMQALAAVSALQPCYLLNQPPCPYSVGQERCRMCHAPGTTPPPAPPRPLRPRHHPSTLCRLRPRRRPRR